MPVRKATVRIVDGAFMPDAKTVRLMMGDLKKRILKDPKLKARWKANPRGVLQGVGLPRVIQNQVLGEEGKVVSWNKEERALAQGCHGCSGCCCTGCCVTV